MNRFVLSGLCVSVLLSIGSGAEESASKSPPEFARLKFRSIGPATGGRVSRVAGVPGDPLVYYAAASAGGVWKSEDGGLSFKPIFDSQPASAIGSIAVSPSDPNVIYVGTGEGNVRGNAAAGDGIYKSTDAGKTWKNVWKHVGHIGTIIVHPSNPDVAYAAVLGHLFGPNQERGVYRTKDGGAHWERVLYKDVDTGASDVCFDPNNPRILFAGLWQVRRKPWGFSSGGPGSALYTSRDGGDTWEELGPRPTRDDPTLDDDERLPPGPYGKICVAVAPSDSNRVYAMIEAEQGGLYRSNDGGKTWSLSCADHTIRRRPWYFSTITVDPKNADIIWAPQVPLMKSIDGGTTFYNARGTHHADHHDCWIDPKNPNRMIVCNDGGVDISSDGGRSWSAPPMAIAQYYHISCDNSTPYRVLGCMQDQGSASGPSNSLAHPGIAFGDWYSVGGGEAGFAVADPADPNIVYAGEYGGAITRYDHRTRQARNVSIYPVTQSGKGADELKYRFQWTAPILISRHDPKTIFHAANVLFRSRDGGQSWDKISLDLTRDDKSKQRYTGGPITGDNTGVEVYGTIFALAESPRDPKLLWCGSDDGLVHISRDGGRRWDNVTSAIPDLPDWASIVCIEPSPFDAAAATIVADAHRLDDFRPHVWRTSDYGATWKRIGETLPQDVYAHVVREDPKRKDLLYLGTERGIVFSTDGGEKWRPLQLNLPPVAVHDLVVKDNDLVVGTMGRSIWILDDITPIREWWPEVSESATHIFHVQPATRWRYHGPVSDHHERAVGENPPAGAIINYFLKEKPKKPLTVEVLDAENKRVVIISSKDSKKEEEPPESDWEEDKPIEARHPLLTAEAGVNRFVWDLTHAGAEIIPKARVDAGNPAIGPLVSPGNYTVKLTVDGKSFTAPCQVLLDPRVKQPSGAYRPDAGLEILDIAPRVADGPGAVDNAAWLVRTPWTSALFEEARAQEKLALSLRDDISKLTALVARIRSIRKQLQLRAEILADEPQVAGLLKVDKALVEKLDNLEARLHNPKAEITYDILAMKGGARLYSQFSFLYEAVTDSDGPPTQGAEERAAELRRELEIYDAQLNAIMRDDLVKVNDLAKRLQAPTIWTPKTSKKK